MAAAAAGGDEVQPGELEREFSKFLEVFLAQEHADAETVAQARALIPQLVRRLIVVDNPAPNVAVPILDWCDYVTESVPGCYGDGDPAVVGPIIIQLLQTFTRSGVSVEILGKIAGVAGKLLSLLAGRDAAAFSLLCAELVAAVGDLIDIASRWHAHCARRAAAAADGSEASMFLVFLDQFGRSMCGETEVVRVELSSAQQAWGGVLLLLQCLWQYAQSTCQRPQGALQPCAPELWAHLGSIADERANDDIRDLVLRLVEFLLCHSVFPDFIDSLLEVLARMLFSPDADFWHSEPAANDDAQTPEPSRREMIVRCLEHDIGQVVEQSPTPPHPSQFAAIMPGLLASKAHVSVKVAACTFFAQLLGRSAAGLEGEHTAQLVGILGTAEEAVQQGIVQCLQVAVTKRMPSHISHKRARVDDAVVVAEHDTQDSDVAEASSGSQTKRRRLSVDSSSLAADSQSIVLEDGTESDIVCHNQDVLLKALQNRLIESLRTDTTAELPTAELRQYLSAGAACLEVFLKAQNIIDWNKALDLLDRFLKAAIRPYVQTQSVPNRAFVTLWTVVVDLLAKLLWELPSESIASFQRAFTGHLSLPLTQELWKESESTSMPMLLCGSARALTLAFADGVSRLSVETLFLLMQSNDSAQIIEAAKLSPFVICTAENNGLANIKECFTYLSKAWSSALRGSICTESSAVLLAILNSLGPLCCICATKPEKSADPTARACAYHERATSLWKCCPVCDRDGDATASSSQRVDLLQHVYAFADDVLSRPDLPDTVTLAFARSTARLLRHMSPKDLKLPKSAALIKSWLGLLTHTCRSVREAVVGCIGVLTADDCLCAQRLPFVKRQQAGDSEESGTRRAHLPDASPPITLLVYLEKLCSARTIDVRKSMLQAVGQLARHIHDSKVLVAGALKCLLVQLTVSDAPAILRVTAYKEIHAIARSKYAESDTSRAIANTVRDIQRELYPGLAADLFRDSTDHVRIATMITRITAVLDVEERDFHRDLLRYSLPPLIRHRADFLTDFVEYFASLPPGTVEQFPADSSDAKPSTTSVQCKLESLVTNSLPEVLVDGLLHCKGAHSDFLDYLSRSVLGGNIQVVELHHEIRTCLTGLVDTAVWEMGRQDTVDPRAPCKGAVACLDFVAGCVDERTNVETLLVDNFPFLMERVNSVLDTGIKHTLDGHNHGMVWITNGSDSDGRHALRGLRNVIEQMGNSIKHFLPVVISTLKKVLERKPLQGTALTVWGMLVHRVPAKLFGPYLCQIVAHLMDAIEQFPNETVAILNHLLDSNKQELKRHFYELPFLPQIPALEKLSVIIDAEIGRQNSVEKLSQLLQCVYNDSPKVRALALVRLRDKLRNEWKNLTELIRGPGQQVHAVIDLMVAALRRGCTDMDVKVQTLSMECFGELGAIDPTKLPPDGVGFNAPVTLNAIALHRHTDKPDYSSKNTKLMSARLTDTDLVAELLNVHLVNFVKAAQGATVHDRGAFAIQELLKLTGIATQENPQSSGLSSRRSKMAPEAEAVWKKLTESTKTLVSRFKDTKYLLGKSSKFVYDGFYTCVKRGHQRWVKNWAYHLSMALQNCKSMMPKKQQVYHVCRAVVRMDMHTANFLLPYLVWDMICYGDEHEFKHVSNEIVGVLKMELTMHEQVPQCQQILFSLLDRLQNWVDLEEISLNKKRSTDKRRVKLVREHVAKVRELFEFIPKITLAKAALQCKAFQRALLCFEEEIRSSRTELEGTASNLSSDELTFLQNVYVGLGDSDGLTGVASTRVGEGLARGEDALRAQIVDHEAAGRWVDATTCYGVLLQSMGGGGSQDSELNDGLMRCMRELGHFHAVLTHAQGTIKACTASGNKNALHSGIIHAADAAWRLGQWDVLADLQKQKAVESTHISVGIGSILRRLEMFKRDDADGTMPNILNECSAMRQRIGRFLSAACMESYERAYPWICQLHQLQELEHACRSSLFGNLQTDEQVPTKSLIAAWDVRLDMMQPQLQCREPVLALRRALLQISRNTAVSQAIGNTWIELAQTARGAVLQTHGAASDQLHTAAGALMQETAKEAENFHIERAKLSWAQNHRHQAITELTAAIVRMGGTLPGTKRSRSRSRASQSEESPIILAKMQLLLGKYGQQTSEHSANVVHHFLEATTRLSSWDKSYFYLARYYDMMYTEALKQQQLQEAQPDSSEAEAVRISAPAKKQKVHKGDKIQSAYERLPDVVHNYGRALCLGHKYLFRCLPRMLTLWFDFSEHMYDEENNPKPSGTRSSRSTGPDPLVDVFKKIDAMICRFKDDIPTYQWFTALPQLISRSTHPNKSTQKLVKDIIGYVLAQHPSQAVWIVTPATKSKNSTRAKIASDIIKQAIQQTDVDGAKTIQAADKVIQELINVCKHKTHDREVKEQGIRVSQHFPRLKQVLSRHADGRVLVPVQSALTIVLPNDGQRGRDTAESTSARVSASVLSMTQDVRANVKAHQAFSKSGVMIEYPEEKLLVLSSLMKPLRLTLRGTDGRSYDFLCKREDKGDMRKDSRLMEFNSMLNRLLRANPESAKRALRLRTFCVCPLNEECGLIEWVPNTKTLRDLVVGLYNDQGTSTSTKEIKVVYDKYLAKYGRSRRMAEAFPGAVKFMAEWALKKYKPVFHRWLTQSFPEPSRWFATRQNVARSTAVWSMVGYILGLGDRHGENILFDVKNGECVHVDFACLFEKGLALAEPEVVPFRLTPNMVDILGVTGTEGAFREVSEVTMKLLREKQDLLMTNLETFLHDPLVEWNIKKRSATASTAASNDGDAAAEQNRNRRPLVATHLLGRIKAKLNGQAGTVRDAMLGVVTSSELPLSVSGQVHRLILDATAVDKLAAMYVWWMAWY